MKKILPFILVGVVAVGVYFFRSSPTEETSVKEANSSAVEQAADGSPRSGESRDTLTSSRSSLPGSVTANEDDFYEEITPAPEAFSSAEEAIRAVQEGAEDYDDLVLEQFVELGDECTWCNEFYPRIREMMLSGDSSEDQKSYYAEILAISGRKENVESLVDAIETSTDPDSADLYAEALEVTIGGEDTVEYLGQKLSSENELLQESVLAALTNHGSRQTVELLYKHTVQEGDPDGYYSLGIGLGEIIPDEDSMPLLTELVNKRDQYSHLALKALLNSGTEGLRIVLDSLENSQDAEFDRQILEDAVDHVSYEDETEALLRNAAEKSQNPVLKEFANTALEDFVFEDELDEEEELDEEL